MDPRLRGDDIVGRYDAALAVYNELVILPHRQQTIRITHGHQFKLG